MMLHEAVMLEIYRQALNASELASPRCQSRESNASGIGGDGRCPSNDSHCSGNDRNTPAPTASPTSPPVGLPLPATLAPAAAAALLPPQSAAVAAYLNAAAAAAQQNHLLLTNPLAAAASLVQQATQQHSPNTARHVQQDSPSRKPESDSILDFSTKRHRRDSGQHSEDDDMDMPEKNSREDAEAEDLNSPLDLSVNSNRKRISSDADAHQSSRKMPRLNSDFKGLSPGTWVPPINPYLAAVAAANLSPKNPVSLDWNGKQKISPNEATKALEKMTEMTRLGAATETEVPMRHPPHSATPSSGSGPSSSNGRHSAWQSHWLNKGADAVKDVFKCVWCKQSFPTLATLTTHMKETQHCGVNVPPTVASAAASLASSSNGNHSGQSTHHARHLSAHNANSNHSAGASASASAKSDLNLLIKETMPLPRKLVRGQDVWLGKGAEQTRQILKCMWCGQSFRSLAEMTSHMQETQHYTNIISQEQIISWKSSDDKSSSCGGSTNGSGSAISSAVSSPNSMNASAHTAATNSTVSAVLTCKVCDQAFASLKELSNHMVKNNHYKEHMMRATGDNQPNVTRRGRQAKEKRKKSLPVRKLLELERAQQDFKGNSLDPALKPLRDFAASTKITCEKCGDKIETALFVDHIRQCLGGSIPMSPRHNNNNNTLKAPYAVERLTSPQTPKTNDSNVSPLSTRPDILCPLPKDGEKSSSTPSVLNAIEQLIEKSFDTRPRHSSSLGGSGSSANTPLGSSILKRLGIDDAVDYTKPLMDAQTMHFLRSYSNFSARDRSTSESSSISERGSSRLESVTPERNSELSRQATPRLTPDKMASVNDAMNLRKEAAEGVKIKTEPAELVETSDTDAHEGAQKISVKKEFNMTENYENALGKERKSVTPGSRAISPSMSERSMTPQSNASHGHESKAPLGGGSLNALSSMFDNLNSSLHTNPNSTTGETNNNNTGKKQNANPLAALQKLCDTTDPPASNTRSNVSTLVHGTPLNPNVGNGGVSNMVAFSWACNDAVMTADSIIKCSFCDTPFCSKGAYRHHLSKVHFVKDDADSQSSGIMKSPGQVPSPKSLASPKSSNSKSPATLQQAVTPPAINPYEESPQSKFLKYTELAKQLSSKNV